MSKIRIQMPQGTGSVSVGGESYEADADGVVQVDHPDHVAPLVLSGGVPLGDDGEPGTPTALMGSGNFPPEIEIGEGQEPLQLGDVVRETYTKTGVSTDEWNNLPSRIRDILLGYQVATRRGEIGDVRLERERILDLETQITELRGQLDASAKTEGESQSEADTGDQGHSDQAPVEPNWAEMTKAQINTWLSSNGGTPVESGPHPAHVSAGQARWAELQQG